ncbi:hypothetical protein GN244_ATG18234 [Phytophthora infestans]|uniref:Transmembrane protein n=1 Tax=Phytophthora infestans TaxID=4787 RepID=A0A833VV21_PHYIN|nr:hypothetical protein GN244_ATG18234 [Phytophthora infestans]
MGQQDGYTVQHTAKEISPILKLEVVNLGMTAGCVCNTLLFKSLRNPMMLALVPDTKNIENHKAYALFAVHFVALAGTFYIQAGSALMQAQKWSSTAENPNARTTRAAALSLRRVVARFDVNRLSQLIGRPLNWPVVQELDIKMMGKPTKCIASVECLAVDNQKRKVCTCGASS